MGKGINLADYSEEEIARIMAMKTKDRNEEETRVYKKKKYVDWMARKKDETTETVDDMIQRNSTPSTTEEEPEEKPTFTRVHRKKTEYTVPSRWMNVPSEDKMDKDMLVGRQCIVIHEDHNLLCRITQLGDDPICYCTQNGGLRFKLTWEQAYIAFAYGTILRLPILIEQEAEAEAV